LNMPYGSGTMQIARDRMKSFFNQISQKRGNR
jgi:hypothetical protein